MKTALVVALVLLVVLTGLPLGMAMAGGCPSCHISDGPVAPGACAAFLGGSALLLAALSRRLLVLPVAAHELLFTRSLERPPQP